jgi:hypothetical protein
MRKDAPAGSAVPAESASADTTPEWAVAALDKVDDLVAKVRSNTTDRLVKVARTVVFGVLAGIMGITALVLGVIAAVRGLDEVIPGPVWGVYLPLGAIFVLAGAFLWSKKTPPPAKR